MVYARRVGNRTLTLLVSGRLWRNSLVMLDEETGTYWSHVTGEALEGPLLGERLDVIPAVQTTWKAWRSAHPDTELLEKSAEVTSSRYEKYFSDPERTGLFRSRWLVERMPGKTKVHGVALGPHALAVAERRLGVGDFVMRELGADRVIVARAADEGVRAFRVPAGATEPRLRAGSKGALVDRRSGSTFEAITGTFSGGRRDGERLEELPMTVAYWFAWSAFYPNTAVVD